MVLHCRICKFKENAFGMHVDVDFPCLGSVSVASCIHRNVEETDKMFVPFDFRHILLVYSVVVRG